uniref:C-type lectin domain-containing protein n=1 Tax=Lates calcarifer TaxID=8187 RepID=A0A4W6CPZ6_LATCA
MLFFITLVFRTLSLVLHDTVTINYNFVRRVGQKYFVSNKERDYFSRATEFCSQQGLELPLPQNEEESNVLIINTSIKDTGCTMLSENGVISENFHADIICQI